MESFNNIPTPFKALMAIMTGTSILGVVSMIDAKLTGIVAVGMLILAALLAAFYFIVQFMERRKSTAMVGNIQQQAASIPTGVNDPARRARLEELRRSFDTGIDKFRSAGKDIYKLPWYLFVGEPGSGKTEAIRHSNVGFPPGLQDELQGAGGTINMHWWFTNQAVFLDTAGRLIFEEVKPGETSEWREFLQLLRRNRPNCPINGLLLVIPADSLIRDNADTVARKAGKIAQQLDTIQRTLDVRFPVFVLITKGDLLNGFREFFEEFSDLQTQHQIFGWSNPGERDDVFRPDLVDQHIETVIARIRKRRLGLLKDPIPLHSSGRRADEVDALFALPQSLSLIAPRLRRYLEMIFVAGEWSAKPLFLRGIYFTSSMREGAALDQELAEAIGCSLDTLPEGKAWERERAYFLRDLFTEKVFRERGLVTRATNTKRLLRRRQGLILGIGAAALACFLAFSFYQHRSLQESVGIHEKYWRGAAKNWTPGKWNPIVKADFAGGTDYRYLGDQPVEAFRDIKGFGEKTLLSVHEELQKIAVTPIDTGWVFKPLAGLANITDDRTKAQHIVFNASLVAPVLSAARQRMQNSDTAPVSDASKAAENLLVEARALTALIRLEADSLKTPDSFEGVPPYFNTLLQYAVSGKVKESDQISRLLTNDFSKQTWPPLWASQGSSTLAANPPIQKGIERLKSYAAQAGKTHQDHLVKIQELLAALRKFQAKEHDMNVKPTLEAKGDPALRGAMDQFFAELAAKKKNLDVKIKEAVDAGVIAAAPDAPNASIKGAYDHVISSGKNQSDEAFNLVQKACATRLGDDKNKLFAEVDEAIKAKRADIATVLEKSLSPDDMAALRTLDDAYMADSGDHKKRIYELRWDLYERCHNQLDLTQQFKNLIGTEWRDAANIKTRNLDLTALVRKNQEKLKDKLEACDYFLEIAIRGGNDLIIDAYLAEVREKIGPALQFPLVWPPGKETLSARKVKEAGQLLSDIRKDIGSDWVQSLEPNQKERLINLPKQFAPIENFRDGLMGPEGKPGNFTLTLLNYNEQPDKEALGKWRAVVVNERVQPTSVASNTEIGSFPMDGDFSVVFKEYSDGAGASRTASGGGSWSLFKLLKQGGKAKQSDGGRRWQMGIPIGERIIWFEFTFEKPLPDLGSWPTKDKVNP